ncbi:MAG TPA: glycerol-3-phosphate dehydrogenase/oxidase [Pyrinomonadaceae bacterium]|jgi:glycerol-3-phosphate dehydrogenase|nr:glycerol-3-phosphate dehydrogenase/oxidase [Pyrinomonadaceae bacterium]
MTRVPQDISKTTFDVIVVGAGVNGCGIARDAAMRGLSVLLLDKSDVSSGTTAWSTRLIHGGLRYLEHGELGLVRESLRERETLLRRVAPHLVRPLPMLVPVYAGRRRGTLTIRAGMLAYDLLSLDKSLPRHRMLSPPEALARAPGLEREGLKGAALFYDAQVEYAERLAVENALAARARGATVITYARVNHLLIEENNVRGVVFEDVLGGATHEARADVVLNVAGPWVDEVLGDAAGEKLIGGTKGSHLVVRAFEGAPGTAVYVEASEDGRPFFIVPWDEKLLIGTTDERYAGDLERVEASEREVEYLLRETSRVLPRSGLTRASVLYTYSGVRPLPRVGDVKESGITRRHFIKPSRVRGLYSIVGGKLTTYRALAEEAVNLVFKLKGVTPPPCETAKTPLLGAPHEGNASTNFEALRKWLTGQRGLAPRTAGRLFKVYGSRAAEVGRLASDEPELLEVISEETGSIAAEVVYAFREEMAETLADCLLRRTMVGLNGQLGLDALDTAARVARRFLGWDEGRAASEVESYKSYVERFQTEPRALASGSRVRRRE